MANHLVFYDGTCGLCDQIVQFLASIDKHKIFLFAPLKGKTAARVLKGMPPEYRREDSLVLVENYREEGERFYVLGKSALRIFWLLGWPWSSLGWISYLPGFLYNWLYRLIARYRRRFPLKKCGLPGGDNDARFLP